MKMVSVAAMLLACAQGTSLKTHVNSQAMKSFDDDAKDMKLSQSFASALQMEPPKLMTTKPLPGAGDGGCPAPGAKLTYKGTGQAFIDGCYMNTTRSQDRNEATGEEAQHFLYMWKHACAYTKWVPSNQFMYSNLDYDADTMTLERFGFIGMEKRCFWGSIGVLWKRPLPVDQILPNTTVEVAPPPPKKPAGPMLIDEGNLYNVKAKKGDCLGTKGNVIQITACKKDKSDYWQYFDNGQIKHKKTGLCMSPVDASLKNGVQVQLQKCSGEAKQEWQQLAGKAKNGQFLIQSSLNQKKCIDLPGAAGTRGLKAQMYRCVPGDRDNFEYIWQK